MSDGRTETTLAVPCVGCGGDTAAHEAYCAHCKNTLRRYGTRAVRRLAAALREPALPTLADELRQAVKRR